MKNQPEPIYFWQRTVSPHMAGLVAAIAQRGHIVICVAEQLLSRERAQQGWTTPSLGRARLELAPTATTVRTLAETASPNAIHICQGIRSNGLVELAQRALAMRQCKQWVIMETVEDTGWQAILKQLEYQRLFHRWNKCLQGVLAIGHRTTSWVVQHGIPSDRVYPFAYFLANTAKPAIGHLHKTTGPFQFIFVGQFIQRKRLDLLILALSILKREDIKLVVIGSGPLENTMKSFAKRTWPGHVHWMGKLPIGDVSQVLASADCLVLPSRHDGWGAVVSEALMVGTPAICSDACGVAEVVQQSGVGGVFANGNLLALVNILHSVLVAGKPKYQDRLELANWARCLSGEAGAEYLHAILNHSQATDLHPTPPWKRNEQHQLNR
ncbi:MAG: glycosyltransferase [Anaerolineaceae bacterium]|nr:glycosyltransferase [Anaerolineaceae bacterium]